MLREIVNTQNAQITFMRGYLGGAGAELTGDVCEDDHSDGDGDDVPDWAIAIMAVLGVLCLGLFAAIVLSVRRSTKIAAGNSAQK